ncbi:MAG: large subunit ribosomal protein L9 [Pseudohongiellaceae bacterium]|jgi:large subunit ribosomal protein L9|tara:strand:- start:136 stop:675 length:540 start_codon:yes stop_codon:yes gene_type:complete
MDVILLQKMGKAGDVGDQITVKAGYARNYLFPFSKAIRASKQNIAEFEVRKVELLKAAAEKMSGENKRAALLTGLVLTIEANASDDGKLYGSIGTREIAAAAGEAGHEIDKSEVELPEGALHELGHYDVTISLSPEVSTEIKVAITSTGQSADAVEGAMDEQPAADDAADSTDETPAAE